ncbi:hypothetical protein BAY61_11810 [Prauserella marina]|uniref:DNA-binding transcriptional activator of the SARP family n=1 Tax=Prauserella marina TaxID=530584 RepID=A0A222VNS8_9PSEU|nr:BTAD domain-containing putative transcriptional regulator [Prauserella marina]ASR35570.1 hypothetical protein BAY61_11810 [Prauserella marina]PWV84582.1 DNA-binding SARP family transcriptional activator [Prauserella marina]SDC18596.1 DNA-binding transcriptional activator of the SARP family [Prauserella marina]
MNAVPDFRILGPVEVRYEGKPLPITAPMQRAVLASLLTRDLAVVPVTALVGDLWGASPPASAVATVRNYIRRLRALLPEGTIESTHAGYRLLARPEQIDAFRLTALGERARALKDTTPDEAVATLTAAMETWRGAPLQGIGDVPLRAWQAPRLEESYLGVAEEYYDLQLRAGAAGRVLADLTRFHSQYPMRERLAGQLMLALYRTGRTADAAACFRRLRATFVNRLGVEPGTELRDLHGAILRQDPELLTSGRSAPLSGKSYGAETRSVLPPVPRDFVGRAEVLDEIAGHFDALTASPVTALTCVVHGQGGVGKSAIAWKVAADVADRFPGGTLCVDLHGATPGAPALSTRDTLGLLIKELGGAELEPHDDLDDVIRWYRARLSGRRVLLVLDNAVNLGQVAPVLPDEPGCAAIVTTRSPDGGPQGVVRVYLPAMSAEESVALLASTAGARKVRAEPEQAARLASQCGGLPLALRLVGTRAATQPHWPLADWVTLLGDERRRLDQLSHEGLDLRASLLVSIDSLRATGEPGDLDATRLFDLLGVLPAPGCTPELAAALTGWPVRRAERALRQLAGAHVLFSPRPSYYVLYDLVALLAKEQDGGRDDEERAALVSRVVRWYLAAARQAAEKISGARSPHGLPRRHPVDELETVRFAAAGEATAWLDAEIGHLVTLFARLAALRPRAAAELAIPLTHALALYFNITMRWRERDALAECILDLADSDADDRLEPFALSQLVNIEGQRGNLGEADRLARRAHELFTAQGRDTDLDFAGLLMNWSNVLFFSDRVDEATALCGRAAELAAAHGYRYIEAAALSNLATVRRIYGDTAEALSLLEKAAHIHSDCGNLYGQAMTYNVLLAIHGERGDHRAVIRHATTALALCDELGNGYCTAECHARTARSLSELGRADEAEDQLARAHEVMAGISSRERFRLASLLDNIEFHESWKDGPRGA